MSTEPANLSDEEVETITTLARLAARQEITSLAGLALRRTQDRRYTRNPERNAAIDAVNDEAAEFWGEVLSDFSGHTGGGEEPGDVEEASAK